MRPAGGRPRSRPEVAETEIGLSRHRRQPCEETRSHFIENTIHQKAAPLSYENLFLGGGCRGLHSTEVAFLLPTQQPQV